MSIKLTEADMKAVVAARVAIHMKEMGFSQAELARRIGATQGAVQQVVSGSTARSRFLPDIAAALGVTVSYLKGLTNEPKAEFVEAEASPEEVLSQHGVARVREVNIS